MELLKELCETPGIPGREQAIIDIMKRELEKSCDEVQVNALGNVIGIKKSGKQDAKKVLIAGHMDEIGFVVSHIDKNGFIRFAKRGGHVSRTLISQRVRIFGEKEIIGIVEGSPPFLQKQEERKKVPEIKDLFIDTGMEKEALEEIVDIGDMIVLDRGFIRQGDLYISKAFDNRIGCYVVLETMKRLKDIDVDVYGVGTSQEEVGIRGAMNVAKEINPDYGIAIDVTGCYDLPGVSEHEYVTELGNGVAIKINDSASISNHGIVKFMKELAKKYEINYQMEILPHGGTDAAGFQRFGKGPVVTLSVPTRYVHSPNEMLHKDDVEATIQLLVKFIEEANACKLEF